MFCIAITALVFLSAPKAVANPSVEMERFVHLALANHPRIIAARARAAQSAERYKEIYEFFDPFVRVAGGASERMTSVPGLGNLASLSSEAFELQGSLQVPFRPGFYISAGLAERYYRNPSDRDAYYQTVAGAGISIPLLRNYAFTAWDLQRRRMLSELDREICLYLAERQDLRREVETAYISAVENKVAYEISSRAARRFEALLEETENLVEYQAIAEYQIFAARTEVELSRAALAAAAEELETSQITLMELTVTETIPQITVDWTDWLRQVEQLAIPEMAEMEGYLRNRGDYLAVVHERLAVELARARELDNLQGDLSIEAAATWLADGKSNITGNPAGGDEASRFGGHIMLVYKRSLGYQGERSRVARHYASLTEIDARLRRFELAVQRDLAIGATRFDNAKMRLGQIAQALDAARKNLAAEEERFQLGEARSRDVLDAQRGMTQAERSQTAAAAAVLRAWSQYRHAAGYPANTVSFNPEAQRHNFIRD